VKDVVREMTKASDEERVAFPDVVRALMAVGLERYHADLICSNKTYYMSDGDSHIEWFPGARSEEKRAHRGEHP
jgi:hypothetical protein